MFCVSRSVASRLGTLTAVRVCGVRHKGTIWIPQISPPPPVNDRTVGPYPNTPEERLKAARKYNLIPEDYEPYDEDEGWGDYPKLPAIGAFNRDKYDDFDDIHASRDYAEPFHRDYDMYTYERIDPLEEKKIPPLVPFWARHGIVIFVLLFPVAFVNFFEYFQLDINHQAKLTKFNGGKTIYAFPPSPNDQACLHIHKHDDHEGAHH